MVKLLPKQAPLLFGAKKVGDNVTISVDDVHSLNGYRATLIGRGKFTLAFELRVPAPRPLMLFSFFGDKSKSIIAQAQQSRPSVHLPKIVRMGHLFSYNKQGDKRLVNVYMVKRYRQLTEDTLGSLTITNRKIVEALQEAHNDACEQFPHDIVSTDECTAFNEFIIRYKGLPKGIQKVLENLMWAAFDYGEQYIFDNFRLENLGFDERGRVVLIDPMFCMKRLQDDYDLRRSLRGTDS